jgi:hypothetical protein
VELIQRDADEELMRLDPDGAAMEAARHVIDLDAESSQCPACMAEIPRGATRCPDCLLRLG